MSLAFGKILLQTQRNEESLSQDKKAFTYQETAQCGICQGNCLVLDKVSCGFDFNGKYFALVATWKMDLAKSGFGPFRKRW